MVKQPIDTGGFGAGDPKPEHYQAIGRLVSCFSSVEIVTQEVFAHLTGINRAIVTTVVGGQRWTDTVQQIKALLVWIEIHDKAMLLSALEDALKIKKVRDIVAHRTWMHRGDEMLFSNAFFAKTPMGIEQVIYTVEYLNQVSDFVGNVCTRLSHSFAPDSAEKSVSRMPQDFIDWFKTAHAEKLNAKFPEPANQEGSSPSKSRKRERPPKPSDR